MLRWTFQKPVKKENLDLGSRRKAYRLCVGTNERDTLISFGSIAEK
jgi:hypothetical protein